MIEEQQDRQKSKSKCNEDPAQAGEQRIKTEEFGQKNKEQRIKIEEIEDFWERFETKCIVQGFANTVFTYLVLVANYYKAPLPQYLVDKYGSLFTEEVKNRFENFLAGSGNVFIRRGATHSNVGVHVIHLQRLKNPIDFLRYLKGVIFPGKEFMISKYIESKEQRAKIKDGKKGEVSSSELRVTSKKKVSSSELRVQSYEFRVKPQKSEIRIQNSELRTGN